MCHWILAPAQTSFASMAFSSFDTELNYDFVKIYACFDTSCDNMSLIGEFSGSGPQEGSTFTSATGIMYVMFESDALTAGLGFNASFWGLNAAQSAPYSGKVLFTSSAPVTAINDQILKRLGLNQYCIKLIKANPR